ILSHDGQLETLRLDKEKAPSSLQANAAPASSPPSTVSDETTEMLAKVREQLLQDPSKAADYIRVQPANVNGEQRGYRIYPGRDRSLFNNAGLRPGDIVTSLNGTPLSDPAQALQMLADVSHSPTLSLTIERGGVQQNVVVNFH
ncbi:PDZ domain-containing protein, partial [Hydrocarboniphaga effusa]|uniref:PDZ domain-containing protein n=1 Tax=Hydrocarboniphaga effusa TaxID=243629 RepID=UPI003137F55E